MDTKDIEKRLQRLEQLHIWGGAAVAILLVAYIVHKNK